MPELSDQLQILDQPRYVCALGAMQTVQGIYRGVPVLHAGPGCAQKLAGGIAGNNGDSGYIAPAIYPCTNISEKETIFGGEERLRETIVNALRVVDGDLYVVLSGCTPEIVGDDISRVVADLPHTNKPVLYVQTAGFKGSNLEGHEWVVDAIIEQYLANRPVGQAASRAAVGPLERAGAAGAAGRAGATGSAAERGPAGAVGSAGERGSAGVIPGLVNLWGPVPSYDPFWVGNIRELEALLRELGLRPNTIFGEYRGLANIDLVPQAQFNLLVSPWVGLRNMHTLEASFGTPYLHYPVLPIGAVETSRFLRTVAEYAGVPRELVEEVVERHEKEYYYHIERTSDVFLENRTMSRRFSIVSNATDTLSVARFLVNDFGLVPERQYITDGTPEEHRARVAGYFDEFEYGIRAEVTFSTDGYQIHKEIREADHFGPPLIIGSIFEKKLAESLSGNFLAVSTPIKERLVLSSSYVGYRGGLSLLEDIYGWVLKQFN